MSTATDPRAFGYAVATALCGGIATVGLATLALEVTHDRSVSATQFHLFVLGVYPLGVAGVVVALSGRRLLADAPRPTRLLYWSGAAGSGLVVFGVLAALMLAILVRSAMNVMAAP